MATMTSAPVPTMEQTPSMIEESPAMETSSSDEDDTLSYFNKLANES